MKNKNIGVLYCCLLAEDEFIDQATVVVERRSEAQGYGKEDRHLFVCSTSDEQRPNKILRWLVCSHHILVLCDWGTAVLLLLFHSWSVEKNKRIRVPEPCAIVMRL